MTLHRKLVLFTLAAAVLPVAAVAVTLLRGAERALEARISAGQRETARAAAEEVARELEAIGRDVSATPASVDVGALGGAELRALMLLVTRRSPQVEAVTLLDERGREVVPALAAAAEEGATPLEGEARRAFLAALPLPPVEAEASRAALVLSGPLEGPDGRPRLAGALVVPGRRGTRWTLGVLVGLDALQARADVAAGDAGAAFLVGPGNQLVLGSRGAVAGAAERSAVETLRRRGAGTYRDDHGREQLAAFAVSPGGAGWGVLVRLPRDVALAEVVRMRCDVLAWSALSFFGFLLLGAFVVRGVASGLERAQGQLLEAQKLSAVGQLGAGVAHEINNPLSGILGHAQILLQSKDAGDPDRAALMKIEEAAQRCREITQNLLRFSQQGPRPDLRATDLNRVVSDALDLTRSQLADAGLALELALTDPPPVVEGDHGHLEQVVLNLLANAQVACRDRPGARIEVSTALRDGRALLSVKDQGKGIAPEVLPRIFEPFFTTKDVWSNVGLGLSVSWRIVAEHQGRIEVSSTPAAGTTFTVVLPASDGPAARMV